MAAPVESGRTLAIIVNWNKADVLCTMLESLQASGLEGVDVVLVDNASTDDSVARVRERFSWVHILENEQNLGGTGGFNCGMRYGLQHPAKYRYLWLLDNDVIVHVGAHAALREAMEASPDAALCGSGIVLMNRPELVQEAGARLNWKFGAIERVAAGPVEEIRARGLLEADYVPACSCMARVEAIEKVGTWDPAYFVFWDDMDWGVRFRRAGFRVLATATSIVRHESYDNRRSTSPPWVSYIWLRNQLYFFHRHTPFANRLRLFFTMFRITLTIMENCRATGRLKELNALGTAMRHFFANRMGKPPQEFYTTPDAAGSEVQVAPPGKVKRIALLVGDNPALARKLYEELQSNFPDAWVDTFLLQKREELEDAQLPNAVRRPTDTLLKRARIALVLALKYDAAANPAHQAQNLYMKLSPGILQFRDEREFVWQPRQVGLMVSLLVRRPVLWLKATWMAVRATLKTQPEPDYFTWRS